MIGYIRAKNRLCPPKKALWLDTFRVCLLY